MNKRGNPKTEQRGPRLATPLGVYLWFKNNLTPLVSQLDHQISNLDCLEAFKRGAWKQVSHICSRVFGTVDLIPSVLAWQMLPLVTHTFQQNQQLLREGDRRGSHSEECRSLSPLRVELYGKMVQAVPPRSLQAASDLLTSLSCK